MEAISTVAALRDLNLAGTAIGPAGLRKLLVLKNLEVLNLQGCTRIGREAEAVLSQFPKLRLLDLHGTALTPDDIAAIQRKLTQCEIIH